MTLWRRRASPPRCIALKALQGEARGRFVPSRLIVPGRRYGSGQMPLAPLATLLNGRTRQYIGPRIHTKYSPVFATLGETSQLHAAQEGNHGVQSPADVNPHPEQKKMLTTSQIFPKVFPVSTPQWSSQWWKTTTVLCELVFAGACRCGAFHHQPEDSSAASSQFSQEGRSHPHPAAGAFVATPGPNFPRTTNRTGEPAPSAGSRLPELEEDSSLPTPPLGGRTSPFIHTCRLYGVSPCDTPGANKTGGSTQARMAVAISIVFLACCLSTTTLATPIMTSTRTGLPLKPPQIISRLPKQQLLKFGPINRFTLECRVQVRHPQSFYFGQATLFHDDIIHLEAVTDTFAK